VSEEDAPVAAGGSGPDGASAAGVRPNAARSGSAAPRVAAGILSSRLLGFVRQALYAHFFGVSPHADVVETAFRSPNLLQNLLGEGTISASFIPVYSRLLAEGRERDAGRFAGAILGLLLAAVAAVVLLGVVFAEPLVALLAPGFLADAADPSMLVDRYQLTVSCVRIVFPMAGLLVLSAWCLGVLNSHRRFFLPYFAPVLWNLAILAGLLSTAWLLVSDPTSGAAVRNLSNATYDRLVFAVCWGALAGGVLQFGVQVPLVWREIRGFRLSLSTRVEGVREAVRATGPVLAGRGVHQFSSYLDLVLASLLAAGALSSLRYAQVLMLLPVSLFGMSVAAAELPELARLHGGGAQEAAQRFAAFSGRVERSARQMLFLVLPTVVGYLAFGLPVVGAVYRRGAFGTEDQRLVYLILAAYTLGLAATTVSRLLQNSFYAAGDTATPAKIAVLRVSFSVAVALPAMFALDRLRIHQVWGVAAPVGGAEALRLGAVGLALGSAVGAWIELAALRRGLGRRMPGIHLPVRDALRLLALALAAAPVGAAVWWLLAGRSPLLVAPAVVAVYALTYLGAARLLGFPELTAWTGRLHRRG